MSNQEYCSDAACPACFLRKSLLLARTQYDSEQEFVMSVLTMLDDVMQDGELTMCEVVMEMETDIGVVH